MTVETELLAFFTNNGSPATGLSAVVDVYETGGTQVVTAGVMTEIGAGWYRRTFAADAATKYVATADGTASVTASERYKGGGFRGSDGLEQYRSGIWIDLANGTAGTSVGVNGTPHSPVDSLADAVTLAAGAGFRRYYIQNGALTLTSSHTDWQFVGVGTGVSVDAGSQTITGSMFQDCFLSGTMVCGSTGITCIRGGLGTSSGFEGYLYESPLAGTVTPAFSGVGLQAYNCESATAAGGFVLDLTNAGASDQAFLHDFHGLVSVLNLANATARLAVSGSFFISTNATSTAGQLQLNGVGEHQDTGDALTDLKDGWIEATDAQPGTATAIGTEVWTQAGIATRTNQTTLNDLLAIPDVAGEDGTMPGEIWRGIVLT